MSYALPNADDAAGARLHALAELFDPVTFRHIEALGIGKTWRCWEIGPGGPSVPRWLAERAAYVLATDLDVSRIAGLEHVDVRVHELAKDPLPARDFDLIHARLVLTHVPARDAALRELAGALRPGGWLVIEDADPAIQPLACLDAHDAAAELANRLRAAFRVLLADRGADLSFGRTLPRRLREAGLADVAADAYFPLALPACATLERATIAQVGARLVERGLATPADLDQHLANLDAGRVDVSVSPLVSAWGRRI